MRFPNKTIRVRIHQHCRPCQTKQCILAPPDLNSLASSATLFLLPSALFLSATFSHYSQLSKTSIELPHVFDSFQHTDIYSVDSKFLPFRYGAGLAYQNIWTNSYFGHSCAGGDIFDAF